MITRYRNKAIKLFAISASLLILIPVLVKLRAFGLPDALVAAGGILLGTFAVVIYVQANMAFAKAKGHDSSSIVATIVVTSVCLSWLFFAMPLIVLFGFEDKTKSQRRSSNATPEPTHRNPPAKLPPLRNDNGG
jgi:hypothetical protein